MRSALLAILAACGGATKAPAPPAPVEPPLQITLGGKPLAIESIVALVDGFDVLVVVSSGPAVCVVPKQGENAYVFRIGRLLHPDGSYGWARRGDGSGRAGAGPELAGAIVETRAGGRVHFVVLPPTDGSVPDVPVSGTVDATVCAATPPPAAPPGAGEIAIAGKHYPVTVAMLNGGIPKPGKHPPQWLEVPILGEATPRCKAVTKELALQIWFEVDTGALRTELDGDEFNHPPIGGATTIVVTPALTALAVAPGPVQLSGSTKLYHDSHLTHGVFRDGAGPAYDVTITGTLPVMDCRE